MKKLSYKIKFYSDWHAGSGLSAGADADALPIKDLEGFPFLPGKTIKGLAKEQTFAFAYASPEIEEQTDRLFGTPEEKEKEGTQGELFFTDATLSQAEKQALKDCKSMLFRTIASTAIDENGIAKEHSLRKMEVSIPLTLEGAIYYQTEEDYTLICHFLKGIKQLGSSRHRGLGRCDFIVEPKDL